eukprot:gnl/MRDRNA2_/MRDRNA2_99914_c0_seq1.p1 gnl/MRDRNA2_/MRDRNA2_99914_c0~~gnl/MRDRNA2_/MRDRNA2_99914_c0_seq1.p1  ORF type:complete len:155 (-),score=25.94 gnl/MRDRNA2_/MRDRNA2_99914_c0_seq1:309-710(-)
MACDIGRRWMAPLFGCPSPEEEDGHVVFEGPVVKKSRHIGAWRKRWAVVTPSHFLTFEHPEDFKEGGEPTEMVPLSELKGVSRDGGNELVLLAGSHGKLNLRCLSNSYPNEGEIQADRWASTLKNVMSWQSVA